MDWAWTSHLERRNRRWTRLIGPTSGQAAAQRNTGTPGSCGPRRRRTRSLTCLKSGTQGGWPVTTRSACAHSSRAAGGSACCAARLQRPAQVKHIGLQCPGPPLGRLPAPDVLGQKVHRHDPFASSGSSASTARCRGPPSGTACPDRRTSNGPRKPHSPDLVSLATASAAICPAQYPALAARPTALPFHHSAAPIPSGGQADPKAIPASTRWYVTRTTQQAI